MLVQADLIVDISPEREKYFGCSGKMLLPCPATVAALVEKIPPHKLATTGFLREKLAAQFGVEVTCPSAFSQALKAVADAAQPGIPTWRVIKNNGAVMAKFPGGREEHAARLREEGFTLDTGRKEPRVDRFQNSLAVLP